MGIARDQPGGHALGKDLVKHVLENGSRIELLGAADRRVLGQVLVYFIAQEVETIEDMPT
jgi:hypothetical protein